MWDLANDTPFATDRTVVRDATAAEVWVVAVKGTFDIHADGTTSVAAKQVDVLHLPAFRGDPAGSSLLYDLDLVPAKLSTDVLVNACAYSDSGRQSRKVDVGISVGPLRKAIRVFGDRTWEQRLGGLGISEAEPFERLPIVYERAFGGRDTEASDQDHWPLERRNPIGMGYATNPRFLTGTRVANLEDPSDPIRSWRDHPAPAAFGAIAPHWLPRAAFAGTYDLKWEEERYPLLPADFDGRFHQCAPLDQQAPLRGDEVVVLKNLTRDGLLQFRLPLVVLGFTTVIAGEAIDHHGMLHTVVIEPEFPRVIMVWHSAVNCHRRSLKVDSTTVWRKRGLAASV